MVLEQKLLEEQRLKDEKVRIERERRRNNLIQAEKRRNERMAQAKEEWEADIIRRRRALEDGKEISRSPHRKVLTPFISGKDGSSWVHTATDISGEDSAVQAIATAAWTDTVKANYKTHMEAQTGV